MHPAVKLHRAVEARFGVVFAKSAAPAGLDGGRVTMLANGAKASKMATSANKEMMLAERENAKLQKTQAKAAVQIKQFAASLLSSQRKAADELHELEKHFG
jgi:uncharacterized protein YlxW (UPF0749 family)